MQQSQHSAICAKLAAHTHNGFNSPLLYVQGVYINSCIHCPNIPSLNECAMFCDECKIFIPAAFGSHLYCIDCACCTGSTVFHSEQHIPGECVRCTRHDDAFLHRKCVCGACYDYNQLVPHCKYGDNVSYYQY